MKQSIKIPIQFYRYMVRFERSYTQSPIHIFWWTFLDKMWIILCVIYQLKPIEIKESERYWYNPPVVQYIIWEDKIYGLNSKNYAKKVKIMDIQTMTKESYRKWLYLVLNVRKGEGYWQCRN